LENFLFACHREARLAEVLAQLLPRDLSRTSHQYHDEVAFRQTEHDAANHLLWYLSAFVRGLLKRLYLPGMSEDLVRDSEVCQFETCWGSSDHEFSHR
jgi:hypothetical protein